MVDVDSRGSIKIFQWFRKMGLLHPTGPTTRGVLGPPSYWSHPAHTWASHGPLRPSPLSELSSYSLCGAFLSRLLKVRFPSPSPYLTLAMIPFTPHHELSPFPFNFVSAKASNSNSPFLKAPTTSSLFAIPFIHPLPLLHSTYPNNLHNFAQLRRAEVRDTFLPFRG